MGTTNTHGWPARIHIAGDVYFFEMIAPITGDPIYRCEGPQGDQAKHALIVNPRGRQNQLRALRIAS